MASKKKVYKAKANVRLKYDDDILKIGQEFEVREEEHKNMVEQGYITLLEKVPKEVPGEEDSKDGN